jgi:hypothetical protein
MKSVKAFCTAAIVAFALSVPAYAGEISSPGAPCPGGSGTSDTTPPAPGDISSPAIAGDVGFPPVVADILLALASIF